MSFVRKTISITKEQAEFIRRHCINLSRFTQVEIDKEIEENKK